MLNIRYLGLIFFWLVIHSFTDARAQNWPCWRGSNGDGISSEMNLPVRWDSVTNVLWKTTVPGSGYSSPVVWEDRLFITTAFPEKQQKALLCYDSKTGALLWQRTVLNSYFEGKHDNNSYASGTPATDGTRIYVSFLDGRHVVVAAYDFSGKQVWVQRPGTFESPHGYSCSPVLYKNMVIINGDSQGDSFVAAMSTTDGHVLWKVPHDRPSHSFSTPIFRNMAGKTQMIFCGNREIASYNPDNGSKYWFVSGPSEDFCSSPVYDPKSGLVLVSSAWPVRDLVAVKPDGLGDVTRSHIAWRSRKGACYVPSPVCADNYLYSTMTSGEVHCMEASTGKILWVKNMGQQYASPVLANGLVYMPNDEGVITVIKPGPALEILARNPLGEGMFASPAISNGKIYLRGFKNLFCIGTENETGHQGKTH